MDIFRIDKVWKGRNSGVSSLSKSKGKSRANGNSEIDRVTTAAARVILSEAKNLCDDAAFLRDSSLRSE